ncbi:MAG: LysM peptidoglycan-binding domain-containing protein [Anaerolineae bacterium]|jgi:LysM repeat protein
MGKVTKLALLGLLVLWTLLAPTPAQGQTSGQSSAIHTVAWGDTLFSIARRYGTTVDAVSQANGLADPTRIYVGQRLIIPKAAVPSAPASAGASHRVQAGENLFRIALRYGVTVKALAELNGIYNADQVFVGQTLTIPGSPAASSLAYQPQHASTTHTIQRGETLTSIAHHYGVSLWTLIKTNNIANSALILPGQTLVIPKPSSLASTPPAAGSTAGKRIVVDLSEQHLYAYQEDVLIYSFVVSTGMPGANTASGTFRVLDKHLNAYASTWNLQMPYWLGIYWAGSLENGIHALPILSNGQRLWEGYLGTPVSYGCVVLGTQEAESLYYWAEVGTPVIIQH